MAKILNEKETAVINEAILNYQGEADLMMRGNRVCPEDLSIDEAVKPELEMAKMPLARIGLGPLDLA